MKICPNCKAENVFDGAQFCKNCGARLAEEEVNSENAPREQETDDDLEFVITEAPEPDALDFLGTTTESKKPETSEDELQITPTSDLLYLEGSDDNDSGADIDLGEPDETTPPIAMAHPDHGDEQTSDIPKLPVDRAGDDIKEPYQPEELSHKDETPIHKSEKGPTSQEIRPYTRDALSQDNRDLEPGGTKPAEDPTDKMTATRKSQRIRGTAYFHKNLIQIVGKPFLHENDELLVNNKYYLLRPKKIDKKVVIGLFAVVLVAFLAVIASQFTTPTVSGEGEIIGMILDENGRPYLEGARVTISSLNKSIKTNAQGFFRFELIPTGSYQLIYKLGDEYVGQGNATVTAGQTTLTTFSDLRPKLLSEKKNTESRVVDKKETKTSSTSKKKKSQSGSAKKSATGYGKIKLEANVNDARFTVDDKILGAGNNTYTRIKSGRRTIKVNKAGYSEYVEVVNLKPKQTITIKANLIRNAETAAQDLAAADYLSLGRDAVASNESDKAIKDFTKAIEVSPGSIEAYEARAQTYVKIGKADEASADYIRIGEIYRINKEYDKAINAFSNALNHSPRDKIALVGRGGAKLDRRDYRSGLVDCEAALKIDNEFYPALFAAGVCQFRLGNHKKAEKHFKKAYEENATDPYLYHYMMLNYLARDNIKKLRKTYAEFKVVANSSELAQFKSSPRFEPILRLIEEEDR